MRRTETNGLETSAINRTGLNRKRARQIAILTLLTGAVLALSPAAPANAAKCWYSAASRSGEAVTKMGRASKKKWACNRARRKCNRARDRLVKKGAYGRGFKCVRVK